MPKNYSDYSNFGNLINLIGILTAVPLLVLPFYKAELHYLPAFAIPSVFSILLGSIFRFFSKRNDTTQQWQVNMQKSSLQVFLAWIYACIMGAVPFVIAGIHRPLHAFFESTSGWTSTGLTVMDVTLSPHIFLFHRCFMQYCGGLGIVLVMLMFVQGKQAMHLYHMAGHPDKLSANMMKSTHIVLLLYVSYTIIGVVTYRLLGMEFFSAIVHSICAFSTGGFSTQLNSIGEYNNIGIEIATIIFMLVGAINFAIIILAIQGKWKQILRISDLRFMFLLLVISIPVITLSLLKLDLTFWQSLRTSAFHAISALTTTGYGISELTAWTPLAIGVMIILMSIGASLGSTAGGIKLFRVYILVRVTLHNIKRKISPTRKVEVLHYMKAQGKTIIDAETVSDVTGFFLAYLLIFIIGMLTLTVTTDSTLMDAGFEFASALGNVGLSIGVLTPESSDATMITLIIGMILGRLEIFIVFIGIYSGYKAIKEKIANLG